MGTKRSRVIYRSLSQAIAAIRKGAVSGLIIKEKNMATYPKKKKMPKPPKKKGY